MLPDDDPRHGHMPGFNAGCRCERCRAACAKYQKKGRLHRLRNDPRAIPAVGSQRRIQALMCLGWSSSDIADAAGWTHRNQVFRILRGQKGRPCSWLRKQTAEKIVQVYAELSMRLPEMTPQRHRTVAYAKRYGYAPPLAWDDADLDDPNAKPHVESILRKSHEEVTQQRRATLHDLDAWGLGISEACRRLDASRPALEHWARRHDERAVFQRLVQRENYAEKVNGLEAS